MATRQGGVYRREKGKERRIVEPARAQRFGAHAHHPSQPPAEVTAQPAAELKATAPKGGDKSTRVKEADDA